jgi:hypothetical protein
MSWLLVVAGRRSAHTVVVVLVVIVRMLQVSRLVVVPQLKLRCL